MTSMTQPPTDEAKKRALYALEMIKNNVDHVAKHPDMQDFVRRIRLYFPQIEAALSATDAPIVGGLDEDEIAEYLAGVAGWSWQTMDANDVSAFRKLARLYAQGRTQSAVPDEVIAALKVVDGYVRDLDPHEDNFVWGAVETLERFLSAAPPVTGGAWLPIESCPKDEEEHYDLWVQHHGKHCYRLPDCSWDGKRWWDNQDEEVRPYETILYWMIPTPPSSQTRGG